MPEQAAPSSLGDARELIDSALDAIIAIDEDGAVTEWNRGAESTFGWTREEAIGRILAETIIPPRYREAHTRGLAHFLATGEGPVLGKRIEIEGLHRDGHELPVELSIVPRRIYRGYAFVAFIRDISERREGEQAIRESARLLERDRARSALLASVSHELRTPLNVILGFAELLEEQAGPALDERHLRYLRNVREAGTGLLELVDDVLELSSLETGGALHHEAIDLVALIGPAVAEAERTTKATGHRFEADAIPNATVLVDPRRIRRVLDDLLSNAVKFTPKGGSITLRLRVEGGDLRIEISDTGIGIPDAVRERVFGLFERLHEGRHIQGGTGLGLHLVKRIVGLHGGAIDYRSDGSGTTFTIALPGVVAVPEVASA